MTLSGPQWNARVEAGMASLEDVPEALRPGVASHLDTIAALRDPAHQAWIQERRRQARAARLQQQLHERKGEP